MIGAEVLFLSFDPHHGETGELFRLPADLTDWNWALSSNGRTLALFIDTHQIRFFSLDSHISRNVHVDKWPVLNGDWATNGKSLLIQSVAPDRKPVTLNVSDTGKAGVVLEGDMSTRFDWLLQSRDGRYGLLEEQVPGGNKVWMIDQF